MNLCICSWFTLFVVLHAFFTLSGRNIEMETSTADELMAVGSEQASAKITILHCLANSVLYNYFYSSRFEMVPVFHCNVLTFTM